jgi:serine phosphatase RsbU (regulator of sigma subunit)
VSQDGTSELVKGNEFPLGGWQIEKTRKFDVHIVSYDSGDMLYLGSDGFHDQFGGVKSKRYGSKRLHERLRTLVSLDASQQKKILKSELLDWKGTNRQTDDICLLGVRL